MLGLKPQLQDDTPLPKLTNWFEAYGRFQFFMFGLVMVFIGSVLGWVALNNSTKFGEAAFTFSLAAVFVGFGALIMMASRGKQPTAGSKTGATPALLLR